MSAPLSPMEIPACREPLVAALDRSRRESDRERILAAYELAAYAHREQWRKSGEPYITHPVAVAEILIDLGMDDDSVAAALLHDVLEDCPEVSAEDIRAKFGDDVLHIVEGVTKLKLAGVTGDAPGRRAAAETTRQAETLRKMLLAMAKDFRVMVIKLADRLHNMQTLGSMPEHKQTRIASETLDVYAPLAARLGIYQIKWQLEDLAFKTLHPAEYKQVSDLVGNTRLDREEQLKEFIDKVRAEFECRHMRLLDIRGRPKHLFSIFNKMVQQGLPFEEIYDLLAIRILVEGKDECYAAMGIVHGLYTPMMQFFGDYIGAPKSNGYQSIHTKVVGPRGKPVEVQIRTREMHEIAEFGIAAHFHYKEGGQHNEESRRLASLRQQLFDWSSDSAQSSDFLRTISTDLFAEQVFVFTPKGDVIDLPAGSTPVDFAFRVHTQLGMTLIGTRVNGGMVPLSTKLKNGDVVELITRSNASPSMDWLEFVKSAHARQKINGFFRKRTKDSDAARGRDLVEKELRGLGLEPKNHLGEEKLKALAATLSVETSQDVLARVGNGLTSAQSIVSKLRGQTAELPTADRIAVTVTKAGKSQLAVTGVDNVLVSRAKCCDPIPGDEVVGYVTRGRGVMVHRKICPNAQAFLATEPDRLMPYVWDHDGGRYSVSLRITSLNRPGLLADISNIFAETKTNVSAAKVKTLPNHTAEIDATIEVTDTDHLAGLMTKINHFSDVISVIRQLGRLSK
ncbi:bifunctional (p)ppGpp synthetase/guanosine-3',5'-bis(diphosphate) 3'-pyrophosphohydrolase [bacterium]|nr:MAG: bifunctional (p)ppGpp synthetase/guanosine-3',5'-bis(diphosphate) 3'-pyrophosphohydrolase [bacterium]